MRSIAFLLSIGLCLGLAGLAGRAMAQDAGGGPPPQDGGGGPGGGGPGDQGGPGGPGGGRPAPGFHLLPRFVEERLDLTDDQLTQIKALEKETKAKLEKILTPDQIKTLDTIRPPRPPRGPDDGGPGGPDGGGPGGGPGGGGGGADGGGAGGPPPPPPQ